MSARGIRIIAALAVSAVGALAAHPGPARAAESPAAPLQPAIGTLFGAYVDPDAQWTGVEAAMEEVTTFETEVGRKLDVDHHYYGWDDAFPGPLDEWDVSLGRIPLISWLGTDLDEILSGVDDPLIHARAADVRDFGAQLFLAWGWEMNLSWTSWGGAQNNDPGSSNGPLKYAAAYRHIHDIFVQEGATNAVWVWTVNHESVPRGRWNAVENYYPGDDYVDWVGIDGYNWGDSQTWSRWTSFADIFGDVYDAYASNKPIMIVEVGSTESGGSKAAWIADTMTELASVYPAIAGFVWFDADKEQDWRPNSSVTAFETYRAMGASPYFQQKDGGILSTGQEQSGAGDGSTDSSSGSWDHRGGVTPSHEPLLRKVAGTSVPVRRRAFIRFRLARPARVWITIQRPNGKVVKRRRIQAHYGRGQHRVGWFLLNLHRRRVETGPYVAVVLAIDSDRNTDTGRIRIQVRARRANGG
ncbi:MAG: glycoside hydrolase family 26 protein [Actinomycetota bacterium]